MTLQGLHERVRAEIALRWTGLSTVGQTVAHRARPLWRRIESKRLSRNGASVMGVATLCAVIVGVRYWNVEDQPAAPSAANAATPKLAVHLAPAQLAAATITIPATQPAEPTIDSRQRARIAEQAARDRRLTALRATSDYRAASAEVDRLEARVRQLRKRDPLRQLPQASTDWIEAKSVLSRMEDDALKG